jgi:hypothetical protein
MGGMGRMDHEPRPDQGRRVFGDEEHGDRAGERGDGRLDEPREHEGARSWRFSERDRAGDREEGSEQHAWPSEGERSRGWSEEGGGWSVHGFRSEEEEWGGYDEVTRYAGRDANGYLVWSGKTWSSADPAP